MRVITVGRSEENDKVIMDPCTSRHHLQIIQHNDGHFTLSDFGSSNGTFVNGQKISGEIPLTDMDIVRIGNTTIPWRMFFDEDDVPLSSRQRSEVNMQSVPNSGMPTLQEDNKHMVSNDNIQSHRWDGMHTIPDSNISMQEDNNSTISPLEKKRHGFVTFWLWFGVVSGVISTVRSVGDSMGIGWMVITSIIASIGVMVAYIMLLKWKKLGFWIFAGVAALNVIVDIIAIAKYGSHPMFFAAMIVAILSGVMLWTILQIKKNGISCWKQLE